MSVLIRIQHRQGREEPLTRLLSSLQTACEIIIDAGPPPENPWRGYQLCLENLPAEGHLAILQDDTIVCRNFPLAVDLIAAARPESVICLFTPGVPRRTVSNLTRAANLGQRYGAVHQLDFVPVVATLWPVAKAAHFLQWTRDNPRALPNQNPRSDDAVAGRWMKFNKETVLATVPSLVQHPDDVPSLIGRIPKHGADKGRVAAHWIGDRDPLDYEW